MNKKLKKLNWEVFVYKRLSETIEKFKGNSEDDYSKFNYFIFDFDETIVTGDIEENLMLYMVNHFKFKMNPEQFKNHLNINLIDKNKKLENGKFTCIDLIDDISQSYAFLWEKGYQKSDYNIEKEEYFQSFRAKLVYYYYHILDFAEFEKGKYWPRFLFVGYKKEEMEKLCEEMLEEMTKLGPKKFEFETSEKFLGKALNVKSSFIANLRFNPEIIDLFETLKENNIVTNIISASPSILVESVCKLSPLNFSESSKVFAMKHTYDDNGKVSAILDSDFPLTKKEGKSEVIEKYIKPYFENKDPIAVLGDSMGDFDMLTRFKDTEISILFNRELMDDTRLIKKLAEETYGKKDARYLVQGKDYKNASFLESVYSEIFK